MSGRGKGGKGLGAGGAKRHRKILRDNIQGVTKPAITRVARRGGVKRMKETVFEETRGVLKVFLANVVRDTVTYTEHGKRKTVVPMDVIAALRRQGRTIYGFGDADSVGAASQKRRAPIKRKAAPPALDSEQIDFTGLKAARGFLVRKQAAATTIQAFARGMLQRRKNKAAAAAAKKEKEAATKIQTFAKIMLQRRKNKAAAAAAAAAAVAPRSSSSFSSSSATSLPSRSGSSVSSNSSSHRSPGVPAAAAAKAGLHLAATIPPRGINNMGNTCFAASIFQLLASSNRLIAVLNDINNAECKLTNCLKDFFNMMQQTSEGESMDLEDFYDSIANLVQNITCTLKKKQPVDPKQKRKSKTTRQTYFENEKKEEEQQDPEETLRPILVELKNEWSRYIRGGAELFQRLFETEVRKIVSCRYCSEVYDSSSESLLMFTLYPVNIKRPSLTNLWNGMHAGENISGHKCTHCNRVGGTTIYKATTHAPEILIFFLQRAKFNNITGQPVVDMQLVTPIDTSTPFTSTFPFVINDAPANVKAWAQKGCRHTAAAYFDFKSCVVKTTSNKSDHYVNVRKMGPGHLFKLDDSKVVQLVSQNDQLNAGNKAILVLYDVQASSTEHLSPCQSI
jgi:histone H4